MSFAYNGNNTEQKGYSRILQGSYVSSSSRNGGRTMPDYNRRLSESSQPLRLPSIQLPPHVDFNRRQNQSRLSTCPSLHQHLPGKEAGPTTDKMLRKFFARPDDVSNSPAYMAPSYTGAPGGSRLPDGLPTMRNQAAPQAFGGHLRRSSISHSHQTYEPIERSTDARDQTSLKADVAPMTYPAHAGSSTSINEPSYVDEEFLENSFQPGSSTTPQASLIESSSNNNAFEEGDVDEGELYRCRDCNRKCKSKASYLKHRSMMCTHRLGALTLECRYCKRHYTYAGYLQRHELECSKANLL
ncbi:hypothetical protein H4Q26_004728 [Puccinia striiformis f. sp. tritici PST-130]|uniref:Uncharacterized protein n=1 Tax=Puccinia striiformis f. sp. tritici PST-78 TaxID=1165861 RepID=A0A0L0V441_9BASI|nr:hypothetical protein H4Q26_004728 [Puccinia striiformis f. sp. tritici PST-130]KNE94042.1 hypothetical protein, variant [Puccinia striiformis f. sp. tritici PST-78]